MDTQLYREESDSMGIVRVPRESLWGAQTQRALMNGPAFQFPLPEAMLRALASVKAAAAETNGRLGVIDRTLAEAIVTAAGEVYDGRMDTHFPVGVFQTGSGTSWNMNMNEVLANRANQILGHPVGRRSPVHPNDHVNRCQSSNDVIPTAMNIAARLLSASCADALERLRTALSGKAGAFRDIPKLGRTHLQDAVPMTLGQEFSGYEAQVRGAVRRIRSAFPPLEELALGGTAVGTGTGAVPGFAQGVVDLLAKRTGIPFRRAPNPYEALASRDCILELMGAVNTAAAALMKIAQDLRLLSSGPRGGLGEIRLPALQPGSSIMPGKINPVVPEIVLQVAVYIMGACGTVTTACWNGPLELNIMQPLISHQSLTSLRLLTDTADLLVEKCVDGIEADGPRCAMFIESSLAMATPFSAVYGYDRAAEIASAAFTRGITVRQAALEEGIDPAEVDRILDITGMIEGEKGE